MSDRIKVSSKENVRENRLVKTLSTFSKPEIRRFRDFIQSPYHNKHPGIVRLFGFLAKYHPNFKATLVTRKSAFNAVFSGQQYDDLKLRHIMSLLQKAAESFLAMERFKVNPMEEKINLLSEFRNRNLSEQFDYLYHSTLQSQEANKKGLFYYLDQYRIELEEEHRREQQEERRKTTRLQYVSDYLDHFYIINKLKQSCIILIYQNVFQQGYKIKMIDEILSHLKSNSYEAPLIRLYYLSLLTLKDPGNEEHFFDLKKVLHQFKNHVPTEEAKDIHAMARNYCIKKINTGNKKYMRELFELYKIGLVSDAISDTPKKFPAHYFKNIISVSLKLQEFEWAESFIHEYSDKLDVQFRKDYLSYALAKLNFEKGQYQEVIGGLHGIDHHDVFIALDARTLLVKTYYELGEFQVLESQLDSFNRFIGRHTELSYHTKNYLNIIKYTKYLMKLFNPDPQYLDELKKKISNEEMLTERDWLLIKLNALTKPKMTDVIR